MYKLAIKAGLRVVHYGVSDACLVRLVNYCEKNGVVTVNIDGEEFSYGIMAKGYHMALNSVAVLAVAAVLGHDMHSALNSLRKFMPLAGRGQKLDLIVGGRGLSIIDDAFNANPGSMAAALNRLGLEAAAGRRIAVLGQMAQLGVDAALYHTALAPLICSRDIDRVYVVGPLFEDLWKIIPEHKKGSHASSIDDLYAALHLDLLENDVVLFKGSHDSGVHRLVRLIKRDADTIQR